MVYNNSISRWLRLKTLALAILVQGLWGCSNLSTQVPMPEVEAPIVRKAPGAVDIAIGSAASQSYTFTQDASLRPPNLDKPRANARTMIKADIGYITKWPNLRVGLDVYPLDNAFGLSSLVNLYGQDRLGFQLALYGRAGIGISTKNGDQNGSLGAGGYDWEARAQTVASNLGFSIGHYMSPTLLIFAGSAFGVGEMKGSIDQAQSDNGSSPKADYSVKDNGELLSHAIGISAGENGQFQLKYQYSQANFDKAANAYTNQFLFSYYFE